MECFKRCLMCHTSMSIQDGGAECDLNCKDLAQGVLEEKNFSMLPRDCSCDTLMKDVTAYCLFEKVCLRRLKSFGSIALAKEISKQPSIYSIV